MGTAAHHRFGAPLRQARGFLAFGLVVLLPPAVLLAQSVSPPIAEYQERARSSVQLANGSIFPLTVVLDVNGFDVTEDGEVVAAPLDTARVRIKLSSTSFRLAPRSTYTVFYEARTDTLPAWFVISAAMSGARSDNGLNLRIILPHVVYLNQKQPLRRTEVVVRQVELDPATKTARVQLENLSSHLGRVLELTMVNGKGQSRSGGAFPLLPHHRRWATVDWDVEQPPERVTLRFAKFSIDTTLAPGRPDPRVGERARSTNAPPSGAAPPSSDADGR